jgi:rhamnose utilization protein RhaD (predicted bifunctional aldolase and dehydrogenase)/NAD(P)-dependent dehydrogenase (short-subunit alcohol dehydrogenase family)
MVFLARLVGQENLLVQPGGGNISIKCRIPDALGEEEDVLVVKGSGTDLATIGRDGFTSLSRSRLARLRDRGDMRDEEMIEFINACMLFPHRDPFPSVETPLHSTLPFPVVLHTHDVASLSLTDQSVEIGEKLVNEVLNGEVQYVPYVRSGFPLARALFELAGQLPAAVKGLALAHHGLVVWGEDERQCHERLVSIIGRVERFLDRRRSGAGRPPTQAPPAEVRRERAAELLPVLRGWLGEAERTILHWDGSDRILQAMSVDGFRDLSRRGMATPDHVLWAGRRPLWIEVDFAKEPGDRIESIRSCLREQRDSYDEYFAAHAREGLQPNPDWAKTFLIPDLGLVTAFRDRAGARAANRCFQATIATIDNAERLGRFEFLSDAEVFEFEYWPLERRKLEARNRRERRECLLPRHVALIIGGGSGIGAASAHRFAAAGAHVMVADLDGDRARAVAEEITARYPDRAAAAAVDVRDENAVINLFRATVLEFGGLDDLFYTAGLAPGFSSLSDITRDELQKQLDIHYLGAMVAVREAAKIMKRQELGGSIICSVSKAALAPGPNAAAYGGSKAALQHALRTAALALGPNGIRVNAINADQVETPLFLRFAAARAAARGMTLEDQLQTYRQRNALKVSLIPPRAVADLAVLLASDRFRYTTGDILTVDGGLADAFPR